MRWCFVSAVGGSAFMAELLDVVGDEVAALGADVRTAQGAYPSDDGDEVFVVVPHEYFVLTDRTEHPNPGQLARTIALCVEHPGNATFEVSAHWAGRLGGVVDINADGLDELARRGIAAERFRLGYSRTWDRWHGDVDRERPVDVTFMGTTDVRRDFVLGDQARALSEWSARLLIPPHEQMTRPRPDFLMGTAKLEHLASTKVLLNLHRGASRSLEWVRVLEAMCNGCVVVSEHSADFQPLVPGRHLAFARAGATVAVASALLRSPARLRAIQQSAYAFCRGELSMVPSAERLLELGESLMGLRPLRPGPPRAAERVAHAVTPEPRAPGTGHPVLPEWASAIPTDVRSELARSWGRALRAASVETREVHLGPPGTAVLDVVLACGRDDVGQSRTLQGLEAQRVPLRILVGTSTIGGNGLGVARSMVRNHLLRDVDAPYVLVIQPNQELLPGAVRRLLAVLDDERTVAASYGMLFDRETGALWNALPFEPERLVRRAYLHAPVLVRADVLSALGGYDEDPALISYEDSDFWLRFAAGGFVARLVPEIVGIGARPGTPVLAPSTWLPEATDALLKSRMMRGPDSNAAR